MLVRLSSSTPGARRSRRPTLAALVPPGVFIGGWIALSGLAPASPAQTTEYAVKAAYLFNFINFTEWPASAFEGPSDPFQICLVGGDPFGAVIDDAMRGEAVLGHPLAVRRVRVAGPLDGCHLVFIPASVANPGAVLRALGNAPVLTVGESEAFWRAGGMLRFDMQETHVRFDANGKAAEDKGLRLSARLMQVARTTLDKVE